jgi:hypothetical protein
MKFRNLQMNLLDILGNEMGRIGPSGSFKTEMLYDQFSDISADAIKGAIDSLVLQGLIDRSKDVNELFLTQKGVSYIETNKNANAGSFQLSPMFKQHVVSQNTLDVCELIENCLTFLRPLAFGFNTAARLTRIEQELHKIENTVSVAKRHKRRKEIFFTDIVQLLEDIAPEGCFFGSHPGIPELMGFWEKSPRAEKK